MKNFSVFLILSLSLPLPLFAQNQDLLRGFETSYQLSKEEMEQVALQLGYPVLDRQINFSNKTLECTESAKSQQPEACDKEIPLFRGKYAIGSAKPKDLETPWLGLNVTDTRQAHQLSFIMQKYVYEGWLQATSNNPSDTAHHFQDNSLRTWCVVPWMNYLKGSEDGERKGRDMFHGLTKEFPIDNSKAFPDIPFRTRQKLTADKTPMQDSYGNFITEQDPDSFSSYGVAWFNRPNCEHLLNVFGDDANPKDPTLWLQGRVAANDDGEKRAREYETADGSVSFKMLFTTLQAQERDNGSYGLYPILEKAYKWIAHVSTHRNQSPRIVQEVSHVQMDIAIKDKNIRGLMEGQGVTNPDDVIPWVMLTYYYDPNYTNPIFDRNQPPHMRLSESEIALAPEGLRHMRPIGIQYGLDKGQSVILYEAGNGLDGAPLGLAKNNHFEDGDLLAQDYFYNTRLNGPADNPDSSCLGCHASSGINAFRKFPGVDRVATSFDEPQVGAIHGNFGVFDNATYLNQVKPAVNVDFNQQIRIGIQRYLDR